LSGLPLREKLTFGTTAVGNGLLVIAKIPIRSFGYAIGLLSARAPPSYSSSPNILFAQHFCRDEKGRQLKPMTIRKWQMNAPVHPLYTNEVSPELLRSLDAPTLLKNDLRNFATKLWQLFARGRHTWKLIPLTPFTELQPRAVKPAMAG
jgi:hypothetical protein